MNDAQSTIAGLKAQECPGGGWTGMPAELERPTVADCLAHNVCGCIYGGAVQHIEQATAWPREAMVKAILDRHFERCLGLFPDAVANEAQARAEIETYRPYAEADVDAIIAVLDRAHLLS
jgi:hypothetical protein